MPNILALLLALGLSAIAAPLRAVASGLTSAPLPFSGDPFAGGPTTD